MMTRRVRQTRPLVIVALLAAGPALALDVDGDWVFHLTHHDTDQVCRLTLVAGAPGPGVVPLSATGDCGPFEGTLDPSTGAFELVASAYCWIAGTFAADGLHMSANSNCLFGGLTGVFGARCTTEPCDYTACVGSNPCLIGSYYVDGQCGGGRLPEAPYANACDDGDPCTLDDRCVAYACFGRPDPGCQPPTCACGPCETCRADGSCAAAPRSDCLTSVAAARLTLHARPAVAGWWLRAGGVSSSQVPGVQNPPALCVFDGQGAVVAALSVSPRCREQSCWRSTHLGARYDDPGATEGLIALRTWRWRGGDMLLRARGRVPAFDALPPAFPLRVQLSDGDAVCWETTFAAPSRAGTQVVQARTAP